MIRSRSLAGLLALGLLCACAAPPPGPAPAPASSELGESAPAPDPRGVVEAFHAALIDAMQRSHELGFAGRAQRIAQSQQAVFHIPTIARASIFRGWKRLGDEDRGRWVALARRYWAAHYAHAYGSFSGERFEVLGVEAGLDDAQNVQARLVRPGAEDAPLDYRLRRVDGAWRIVDFGSVGASEVRRLREFNYAVLERRGFEALLTEIEARIEAFARE